MLGEPTRVSLGSVCKGMKTVWGHGKSHAVERSIILTPYVHLGWESVDPDQSEYGLAYLFCDSYVNGNFHTVAFAGGVSCSTWS